MTEGGPARLQGQAAGHTSGHQTQEAAPDSGPGESLRGGPGQSDTSPTSHIDPLNCAPSHRHISSVQEQVRKFEVM